MHARKGAAGEGGFISLSNRALLQWKRHEFARDEHRGLTMREKAYDKPEMYEETSCSLMVLGHVKKNEWGAKFRNIAHASYKRRGGNRGRSACFCF